MRNLSSKKSVSAYLDSSEAEYKNLGHGTTAPATLIEVRQLPRGRGGSVVALVNPTDSQAQVWCGIGCSLSHRIDIDSQCVESMVGMSMSMSMSMRACVEQVR